MRAPPSHAPGQLEPIRVGRPVGHPGELIVAGRSVRTLTISSKWVPNGLWGTWSSARASPGRAVSLVLEDLRRALTTSNQSG